MKKPTLVIATRNPGKVAEFDRLLAGSGWTVVGLDDVGFRGDVEETADDYAGNATLKAETVSNATGLPVLADDSGLEVIALDAWPGLHSARWLGPGRSDAERLTALIAEVDRRSPDDRRVRYVAALALARPGAATVVAHGHCEGLLVAPEGSGGFGYDPSFLSDDLGVTFGAAVQTDKDRVSHRARALQQLTKSGLLTPSRHL